MIRRHVVQAIFRRNFASYFNSPTGYVYIAVFVIASAALAFWRDAFFVNNLANLDTLNRYFPVLLLFFVPAVAMATWAEERKQGTDELLLTLPANDFEIVLGKYLATLGIYTTALGFSLSHVVVLGFLGKPDLGVMVGTYLGYEFLGAALLAVAMTASLLSSTQTVAFILGILFCAVVVSLSNAGAITGGRLQGALEGLGVDAAFGDLTSGVVSLTALVYFVSVASLFLYLNLVLLARRHAKGGEAWLHFGSRSVSILIIGVTLGVFAARSGARVDLTSERLHTLTKATRDVLSKIDTSKPVYVQAYVSPDVPAQYVETRETLLGLLREIDAIGGDRVHLRVVDTERYSAEARQAEEQFGIKPESIRDSAEGEEDVEGIFMGIAFTCGAEEVVVPFFHRGLPIEYELTRSLGTVIGEKRRRVGVAATDARLSGGMDIQSMSSHGEWQILSELKKQYEVVQVGLDAPLLEKYDALLVALPSSLSQPQMDNLLGYIRAGNAVLLFDDPFPAFNPRLAASEPRQPAGRQMGFMPPPPQEPKGDIAKFMNEIGLHFPVETVVWDTFNPHPKFKLVPREVVFVGTGSGNPRAFNPEDSITSGLQEMVFIYGGEVRPRSDVSLVFTPLLKTTAAAGSALKGDLFQQSFFGMARNENLQYRPRGEEIILAARVKGAIAASLGPDGKAAGAPGQINVVFAADLDCLHDQFFQMRREAPEDLQFDNVTFVLNCVDVLAGDESYVELRKRRPKYRTLETVEKLTKDHRAKLIQETKSAEEVAEKAIKEAQARLDAKVEEVRKRTDIDERRKDIELKTLEEAENKRLAVARQKIEDDKRSAIDRSKGTMNESVRAIKRFIKVLAVFLPPIPALLIGIYVFLRRVAAQGRTV